MNRVVSTVGGPPSCGGATPCGSAVWPPAYSRLTTYSVSGMIFAPWLSAPGRCFPVTGFSSTTRCAQSPVAAPSALQLSVEQQSMGSMGSPGCGSGHSGHSGAVSVDSGGEVSCLHSPQQYCRYTGAPV